MMKFEVPRNDLIAALKFTIHAAGVKDVRYYLNGVLFQIRNEVLTLVATDGHRIAVTEIRLPFLGATHTLDAVVSRQSLTDLLKIVKPERTNANVECDLDANDGGAIAGFSVKAAEGKYPEWQRVVRDETKAHAEVGFNAAYVEQAMKAAKELASKSYHGVKVELKGSDGAMYITPGIRADFPTIRKAFIKIPPIRV